MTLAVDPSAENILIAEAVARRMGADSALTGSHSAFWRYLGAGTIVAALGLAVGLSLYAYAQTYSTQVTGDMLAEAMMKAFAEVTLKTETRGEVTAAGTVSLRSGQVVTLAPDATVGLDPSASVKVKGEIRIDGPAAPSAPPAPAAARSAAPVRQSVVNYTVFKTVGFGKGRVETGWQFASSNQSVPSHQYCHYVENLGDGAAARILLGEDGRLKSQSRPRTAFDAATAYSNCVWFNGSL